MSISNKVICEETDGDTCSESDWGIPEDTDASRNPLAPNLYLDGLNALGKSQGKTKA